MDDKKIIESSDKSQLPICDLLYSARSRFFLFSF